MPVWKLRGDSDGVWRRFGTMPAFAADYFGPKNVGPIYGLMLTAWGFASAFGPLLIAKMRQTDHEYGGALHVVAGSWPFPSSCHLLCGLRVLVF